MYNTVNDYLDKMLLIGDEIWDEIEFLGDGKQAVDKAGG